MRYIDDFIEHLWNTFYRKIERQKAARDLAGWTRRRKTTKDPEDSRRHQRHDWGCGWGWGWRWSCGCQQDMHGRIEHFTPTKDNKKNTEEEAAGVPQCRIWVSAADTEIPGRLWASPLRWLWLPREKKRRKNEEKQQMKEQNVTTNATKRKVGVDKQMKIGNPAAHDWWHWLARSQAEAKSKMQFRFKKDSKVESGSQLPLWLISLDTGRLGSEEVWTAAAAVKQSAATPPLSKARPPPWAAHFVRDSTATLLCISLEHLLLLQPGNNWSERN